MLEAFADSGFISWPSADNETNRVAASTSLLLPSISQSPQTTRASVTKRQPVICSVRPFELRIGTIEPPAVSETTSAFSPPSGRGPTITTCLPSGERLMSRIVSRAPNLAARLSAVSSAAAAPVLM